MSLLFFLESSLQDFAQSFFFLMCIIVFPSPTPDSCIMLYLLCSTSCCSEWISSVCICFLLHMPGLGLWEIDNITLQEPLLFLSWKDMLRLCVSKQGFKFCPLNTATELRTFCSVYAKQLLDLELVL